MSCAPVWEESFAGRRSRNGKALRTRVPGVSGTAKESFSESVPGGGL